MAAEEEKIQGMSLDAWLALIRHGMRKAIQEEVRELRREGRPILIFRDGKVVNVNPSKRRSRVPKRRSK